MDGRCRRSAVFRLSSAVAAEVEEAERAVAQASQRAEQVQKKREDFLGFCTTRSERNSDFGVRNAETDRSRRVVHDIHATRNFPVHTAWNRRFKIVQLFDNMNTFVEDLTESSILKELKRAWLHRGYEISRDEIHAEIQR